MILFIPSMVHTAQAWAPQDLYMGVVNWQRTRCAAAPTGLDLGGMVITDCFVSCFPLVYSDANTLHDTNYFPAHL